MTNSIILEVNHPDRAPSKIEGFSQFWAYYVSGIRPGKHCQECFKGRNVANFGLDTAHNGEQFVLDPLVDSEYVYVCGFASGAVNQRYRNNFHLALRYEEGRSVSAATRNDYVVTAQNAVMLQIPSLPKDWNGLPDEVTRCKNFQFAHEYFVEQPKDRAET